MAESCEKTNSAKTAMITCGIIAIVVILVVVVVIAVQNNDDDSIRTTKSRKGSSKSKKTKKSRKESKKILGKTPKSGAKSIQKSRNISKNNPIEQPKHEAQVTNVTQTKPQEQMRYANNPQDAQKKGMDTLGAERAAPSSTINDGLFDSLGPAMKVAQQLAQRGNGNVKKIDAFGNKVHTALDLKKAKSDSIFKSQDEGGYTQFDKLNGFVNHGVAGIPEKRDAYKLNKVQAALNQKQASLSIAGGKIHMDDNVSGTIDAALLNSRGFAPTPKVTPDAKQIVTASIAFDNL